MRTEDLITMLSTGASAGNAQTAAQRYGLAFGWAAFFSTLLMALFLGVRPDLVIALRDSMFWVKFAFSAILAAGGLIASLRLARPGSAVGFSKWIIGVPILIIWIVAAIVLINAPPSQRVALVLGQTWSQCPLLIAGLSAPGMIAFTWAMRGLASTRQRLAGAATGLLSGAVGATVYCLHCPELAAPFIGVWYVAGILIPTVIGFLIGKRILAW